MRINQMQNDFTVEIQQIDFVKKLILTASKKTNN